MERLSGRRICKVKRSLENAILNCIAEETFDIRKKSGFIYVGLYVFIWGYVMLGYALLRDLIGLRGTIKYGRVVHPTWVTTDYITDQNIGDQKKVWQKICYIRQKSGISIALLGKRGPVWGRGFHGVGWASCDGIRTASGLAGHVIRNRVQTVRA